MLRLLLRSLLWYRRTHLLVLIAVVVSTAVIAGSLITGDSIRGSLRQMTLSRLGRVSHILHSPRFVRQQLAEDLRQAVASRAGEVQIAPALILTAGLQQEAEPGVLRRASGVQLSGLDNSGWSLLQTGAAVAPVNDEIVLGYRTAEALQAAVGDEVSVWVELPASIPRDSLMGEREEVSLEIVFTVSAVLDEQAGASRFSLQVSQQLPNNAFVSLQTLQERLGLEERPVSRRTPVAAAARVNTLLISVPGADDEAVGQTDEMLSVDLQEALQKSISLTDLGMRIRRIEERGYLSVESDSMILEDQPVDAVMQAARDIGMLASPVVVYLINEFSAAERTSVDERYSMYSLAAGADLQLPLPLGPFTPESGDITQLGNDGIVLSSWLAEDLQVKVGDAIDARWHEVGSYGELPELTRRFTVRAVLPATQSVSLDRDLTPFVDGVTNVDGFDDWDQPFPMEMDRITSRDDDWWETHRATPRAFVSPETAAELWDSRFGRYTSVRIGSAGVALQADALETLEERILASVPPLLPLPELNLQIRPVRSEGLRAAVGANNFGGLFIGFSFFLIVSAILLASLMFQLGLQQRVAQAGLLEAIGFTHTAARRPMAQEGLIIAALGGGLGLLPGVKFAELMIYGLTTWWKGATGTQFLLLDVRAESLLIAFLIVFVISGWVILRAVRQTTQGAPRALLQGAAAAECEIGQAPVGMCSRMLLLLTLITGMALPPAVLSGIVPSGEAFGGLSWQVVCFFLAGFSWLAAFLLLLRRILRGRGEAESHKYAIGSIRQLAFANASRNPQRSVLTTTLIALATFVIVAVGAGRRNPVSEQPDVNSGNGGFRLVAESSLPVLFDLNTTEGREKLQLDLTDETSLPAETVVHSFRVRPGEDASCLNLFQTSLPTLLGATDEFIDRGGFRFADTPSEKPWAQLREQLPPREMGEGQTLPVIPVLGDLNTLQFSLKKRIDDVILFPNEQTPTHVLQISGMLDSSIFQGVLVMTEENLRLLAPETSGSSYFLIEAADAAAAERTAVILETVLQPFGMDVEQVSRRLADFLAVQNTYLSTFQLLGGLGLLVGTLGLATVMVRNVLERRREIAMLRALGFRGGRIARLILTENTALLMWGLLAGTVSALTAMLPHLRSTGADVPWEELAVTLVAVAVVGMVSAVVPIRAALRVTVRDVLVGE